MANEFSSAFDADYAVLEAPLNKAARFGNDTNVLALGQYYQPVVMQGHYDSAYATSYIDIELDYDADEPIEINTIIIQYIWRDTLVGASIGE